MALFLAAWPAPALAATLVPEALAVLGGTRGEPSGVGGREDEGSGPLAALRLVPAPERHATLVYLGAGPLEPVLEALDALDPCRGEGGPARDRLDPVDAVVGTETAALGPGALVVPITGLDPLAGALRGLVEAAGVVVAPDGRPTGAFVGHVTVARPRKAAGRRRRAAALRAASGLAVPAAGARWAVDEVVLAASDPLPDGADRPPGRRYGVVRRVTLG